jgi:putative radical SAM enzyme (TIGR03279 family)
VILRVERAGAVRTVELDRAPGEPLGVAFDTPVFDSIRECDNACAFCFVAQLPKGLRPALYVRDDDFRLSFLTGNFVTLTNVAEADVERILEQHLSPLHVSVHAVDPWVRSRLMCPTAEDRALEVLDQLLRGGIEVHAQVVLVPGINDDAVLVQTLDWLKQRPGVLSVGLVPMGFTAHQSRWTDSYDGTGAAAVLDVVDRVQARVRAERGFGWAYAADEFYLLAGAKLPPWPEYDGFPQYENGIGMVRAFLDEFAAADTQDVAAVLVTGVLFAPVLRELLASRGLPRVQVLPVRNRLFGGNVGVTGLLSGRDLTEAIRAHSATPGRGDTPYLVPDVVVNSDGLLLDDIPATGLAELAGADVRLVGSDAGSLAGELTELNGRADP